MSTETPRKESFADLFAKGDVPVGRARRLSIGEKISGVVVHVSKDSVIIDLDEKQQGFFDTGDAMDAEVGKTIEGYVVDLEGGNVKLARRFGREVSVDHLRIAMEAGTPVEGKVTGTNKGGVEVDLAGVRAFCPASQLDDKFVPDMTAFVGKSLSFAVTKVEARDVVLSRRALLERESRAAREKTLAELEVGAVRKGRVSQLRDFGAFVDIGGIEGLIPLRELSHDRVRAEDVVSVGDVVEVQVKQIEKKNDKTEITLSLKSLAPDPWAGIEAIAPLGRVVAGQISRLADFGAFVRLAPGVEGLLHVSELSGGGGARVAHPSEALAIGDSVLARVKGVDPAAKRISLALASEGAEVGKEDAGSGRPVVGAIVKAVVEKVESWGVSVQIAGTRGRVGRGSIPNSETGTRAGADLRKEFPPGKEVTAKVVESSESRLRLSIRAALEDAERADFDTFRQAQKAEGKMGTFGDLLKKKIKG